MAKNVPSDPKLRAAFNKSAAMSAAKSFGVSPASVGEAYRSGFVSGNTPLYGSSANSVQQTILTYTPEDYYDPITESLNEEGQAKEEALRRAGLGRNDYSDYFYNPFSPEEYEDKDVATPQASAPLLDIPTSTTNYKRPRTVAAGWVATATDVGSTPTGTLTVIFRDGTPYNFYDVPETVWLGFHQSISKGRSYLNLPNSRNGSIGTLLAYSHGPADVSALSADMLKAVYAAARMQQIYNRDKSGKTYYQYEQRRRATTSSGNPKVGGKSSKAKVLATYSETGSKEVKVRVPHRIKTVGSPQGSTAARRGGTNPNKTAGKNPHQ
ncbi:KTSC domain containing protein [uncultured Caudovirales phage]|uniref:KTSC domain containing protein n=1 Tax=uncultured Caudovirales phage TaxID=2100421 RepID=A0A6J5LAU1_9CAUD|nr:KTSC domain containing protein [uncultured Caudovirales phage]